jgi:hypothetical protein
LPDSVAARDKATKLHGRAIQLINWLREGKGSNPHHTSTI